MKSYTITKAQLLQIYQEGTDHLNSNESIKLPNDDLNVRIPKSEILQNLNSIEDHQGWHEIVPAQRKLKKVLKLNQDQFADLLAGLLSRNS